MALDPFTLLVLTTAMAAASALYLAAEWSSVRERSLLLWSAGFAIIVVGCVLALLRSSGHVLLGIWFPNGLLIAAHWLFLAGVAGFMRVRLSHFWWLLAVVWLAMLFLPDGPWWSKAMLGIQSLLIAITTLRAGLLLRPHGGALGMGAAQLSFVLLAHGLFYLAKAGSTVALDAFVNLGSFRGTVILISLVEGVMAIMLLAMSMTGTERHRREERIAQIAARDPLTSLDNRRALYLRAPALLAQASPARPGALLLIDIDHFKQVNDLHGHDAGPPAGDLRRPPAQHPARRRAGRAAGRGRIRDPADQHLQRRRAGAVRDTARGVRAASTHAVRDARARGPEHWCHHVRPARHGTVALAQAGGRRPLRIQAQGSRPDGAGPVVSWASAVTLAGS